jgi:hypothetical protein
VRIISSVKVLLLLWAVDDASEGTQEDLDAWVAYDSDLRAAGVLLEGGALQPLAENGLIVPRLAESRPDAGEGEPPVSGAWKPNGFYLLDCEDITAAHEWARRAPTYGRVEVRPMFDFDLGRND